LLTFQKISFGSFPDWILVLIQKNDVTFYAMFMSSWFSHHLECPLLKGFQLGDPLIKGHHVK